MPISPDCRLISLTDQVRWLEKVLFAMQRAGKPEGEIALQEAALFTVKERMRVLHEEFKSKYDPKYGDNRICKCGHIYYRHFDTYDGMEPVGCKYCGCQNFIE